MDLRVSFEGLLGQSKSRNRICNPNSRRINKWLESTFLKAEEKPNNRDFKPQQVQQAGTRL